MRTQLLGLAGVSVLFLAGGDCCGVGEPYLMPAKSVYEGCSFYDCPIAIGSEVEVIAASDIMVPGEPLRGAKLSDPAVADLSLFPDNVVLRAKVAGHAVLTATLSSGRDMEMPIEAADRATTLVGANITHNTYPPGPLQVFTGASFAVAADHRDAANRMLLGSGLEAWSATGGTLEELPYEPGRDTQRTRLVRAGAGPLLVVHARPDDVPLEVEVLPAGSTASLELEAGTTRARNGGVLGTFAQRLVRFDVWAYAANGRYIYGVPPGTALTASTDNFDVATAQVVPGTLQIEVWPVAPGSTVLSVGFDGITRQFRIDVQ